jgi:hypothetical protein
MRNVILVLAVLGLAATTASAQGGWAEKMFKDGLTHDFGSVPKGAQLFHRFTITNIYAVRMEIMEVKSGCSKCVSATAAKRVLESRESTTIDVSMDARQFNGVKKVAINVSVGPEFISSAQLIVTATSRADIVFNPGEVNLGSVVRGQAPTQTIDVEYAGSLDWQVSEVSAKDMPVDVQLVELYRRPGQVGYQARVTLKRDAPLGPIKGDIFLKTNDPGSPLVPVLVEANVQAALTVTPDTLALGTVKVGETIVKRAQVRGTRPFKVVKFAGGGEEVKVEVASKDPAPVQIVTFRFHATQPGELRRELKLFTDLQPDPVTVILEGSAQ